jgi:membrane protein DedA with SNARE-associated domain
MELDFILDIIEKNGYIGLFLWLWIGVIGIPVPNEIIAMTVGFAASQKVLHPFETFVTTYLGILAAITTSYLVGKFIGIRLLPFLKKREHFAKNIDKSLKLIERYHAHSLSFSYFIPGLRNFVPFLYGLSGLPYRPFAFFAYLGVLLWLTIAFSLGYWFGDHQEKIVEFETEFMIFAGIVVGCYLIIIYIKKKRKQRAKTS